MIKKYINKYSTYLKNLKENFARDIEKLSDSETKSYEDQIRNTVEIIRDLKELEPYIIFTEKIEKIVIEEDIDINKCFEDFHKIFHPESK